MFPMKPASYRLTHRPTGRFYVGSTNNLARRILRHVEDLNRGNHHCAALQEVYGNWEEIEVTYVVVENVGQAHGAEEVELHEHRGNPLFANVGRGVRGPWVGGVPPEQRAKMTEGLRRYHQRPEVRERMRQQASGHVHSEQHKQAISSSLKGIKRSDATKEKLSRAQKESADKRRNLYGGKSVSPERSAQISAALSKSVSIDGVTYSSATEAAATLGVVKTTVMNRVRSQDPKFAGWKLN